MGRNNRAMRRRARRRNKHNNSAQATEGRAPVVLRPLTFVAALVRAFSTFTFFPSSRRELPDISWRGQGRAMRQTWRQTAGCFRAAYDDEVSKHNKQRHSAD